MTLNEALAINSAPREQSEGGTYFLACGFEPLHLKTFLRAHLLERLPPQSNPQIQHGVYGDLRGNIEFAEKSAAIGCAVVVEWSDIDPRLGLRSSGGWSKEAKDDILASSGSRYACLETALKNTAGRMPAAVAPPSLPLPPIGHTVGAQSSIFELELKQQLAAFMLRIARISGVRVVNRPPIETPELDAKMELLAGFPYTVAFADVLAGSLARVLYQGTPKKGLITDLDNTLWSGIVGEVGVGHVSWSQEHHTQAHGLYQQMLGHLADSGVLLAVCSKNELTTVEAALAREDMFLNPESFFPVHASWGPKSASVAEILKTWNIASDAVVFVDDSPMELEEVERAHPGITCLRFPGKDAAAVWKFLGDLREVFGKPVLMEEDQLRQASIRANTRIPEITATASAEFLATLQGKVTLDWNVNAADKRPLELINKTNQFNLNGLRIEEGEWRRQIETDGAVLAVVSYQDKFGPLGKIAVLLGTQQGPKVRVSHWVMSCRAFSRKIEHQTLQGLFDHTNAGEVEFAFKTTERNQPLIEFFLGLDLLPDAEGAYRISRTAFQERCGALPHLVANLAK